MAERITPELLVAAVGCTRANAERFAPHLAEACRVYAIDTPARLAAFLAQLGHESVSLAHVVEVWGPTPAQERYEGRADLGNTEPGDGLRYRGHGLIQVTGRANHAKARNRLRARFGPEVPDFEADPQALQLDRWAALSAGDYWDANNLNALADAGNFEAITRRINGGLNGQADRLQRWQRASAALDVRAGPPAPIETRDLPKEPAMPVPVPFLLGLASTLIDVFSPLAKEKVSKEMARHTADPAIAARIADGVLDVAKTLTAKTDPVEAVVAAKADPAIMAQVEASVLDDLLKMAPLLDKVNTWERDAWAAEEASRDAAAARAREDKDDQDAYLTKSIVDLMQRTLVGLALLAAALAYFKVDVGAIIGTILTLVGFIGSTFRTRYDHRYGSSRSSGAKDLVLGEVARRQSRPQP